jgi:hypothetical protein
MSWGVARRVSCPARLARTIGDKTGVVMPNRVDFNPLVPGEGVEARRRLDIAEHEQVVRFGETRPPAALGCGPCV